MKKLGVISEDEHDVGEGKWGMEEHDETWWRVIHSSHLPKNTIDLGTIS